MEAGAWTESLKQEDYQLALTPYTLMTGDPDFFFGRWIYSQGQMNKQRGLGYNNAQADQLITDAAAENDTAKRKDYYKSLQQIVAQDVPLCPLFHDVSLYAVNNNVQDLTMDAFFEPSLERAWIK